MKVNVKNDLPAAVVDVDHQPITTVSDAPLTCQAIGHERDGTHPHRIIGRDVQEGWYVLPKACVHRFRGGLESLLPGCLSKRAMASRICFSASLSPSWRTTVSACR